MSNLFEVVESIDLTPEVSYPVVEQHGPLRRYDKEMACKSPRSKGNCRSSTYFKLLGIPTCMTHALYQLNDMLYERGVDG